MNIPVIVGIGEVVDRPDDPALALEPLASMAKALRRADTDAGGGWIPRVDSLDIVQQVTWRYEATAARLCERLGIAPRRAIYGITGGESPVRYLHEAALRIATGESEVAAVCGAEARHALAKAASAGITLPWTPQTPEIENAYRRESILQPIAIRHGMMQPVQIYPLYENATLAAWVNRRGQHTHHPPGCGPPTRPWRRPIRTRGFRARTPPRKSRRRQPTIASSRIPIRSVWSPIRS